MPIIHIVLFQFSPDASQAQIEDVRATRRFLSQAINPGTTLTSLHSKACTRMTGLADKCVHPTSKEKYFKSYSGGKDNSPEGKQVYRPFTSFHTALTYSPTRSPCIFSCA